MAVDPIGLLDRIEHGTVLRQDFPAALDAVLADEQVQIVPERLGEFGLGVHQVHDSQVGRQAIGIGVEGGAGDAPLLRGRPQALQAGAEIRRRGEDGFGGHEGMARTAGLAAPVGGAGRLLNRCRNRTRRPRQGKRKLKLRGGAFQRAEQRGGRAQTEKQPWAIHPDSPIRRGSRQRAGKRTRPTDGKRESRRQCLLATPTCNAFQPSSVPIVISEALTLGLRTGGIAALIMDSTERP
jgi:hypothetical protein